MIRHLTLVPFGQGCRSRTLAHSPLIRQLCPALSHLHILLDLEAVVFFHHTSVFSVDHSGLCQSNNSYLIRFVYMNLVG